MKNGTLKLNNQNMKHIIIATLIAFSKMAYSQKYEFMGYIEKIEYVMELNTTAELVIDDQQLNNALSKYFKLINLNANNNQKSIAELDRKFARKIQIRTAVNDIYTYYEFHKLSEFIETASPKFEFALHKHDKVVIFMDSIDDANPGYCNYAGGIQEVRGIMKYDIFIQTPLFETIIKTLKFKDESNTVDAMLLKVK